MTSARTRARWAAAVAAAAVALLAGCTAPPAADPAPERTPEPREVVVGVVGSLTSFNPLTAHGDTAANRAAADYLHESFAYLDDDLQVVGNGGFGEVERISADPLIVQYRLFDGRSWSDGTPVTVDDLLFGWAVHSGWFDDASYDLDGRITSGTRYFDVAADPDGIRDTRRPTIDRADDTITLRYDEPFADWNREWLLDRPVHVVADAAGVSVRELMTALRTAPRGDPLAPGEPDPVLLAVAEAWNSGFDLDPTDPDDLTMAVSNGPYAAEAREGDDLVLRRNELYEGNHQPAFDRLRLRFLPDERSLRAALAAGDVDVANIGDATAAEIERLAEAGVEVLTGPRPRTLALVFVDEDGTLRPDVRDALLLSLDRQRIVDETVRGVNRDAEPLQSFLASAASGETYDALISDNAAPEIGPDEDAARELLDGRSDTVRIRYEPTDVLSADLFAEIAAMAERVGISVRPARDDDAADAEILAADLDGTLYEAAAARVQGGAGGRAALDALERMRGRSDPEEVVTAAQDVDRALFDDAYGVPLVERAGAVAVGQDVEGVAYTSAETAAPRYFWTWTPRSG